MCIKQTNSVSWQVSSDGTRMIGHMILRKCEETDNVLGMKVVGGRIGLNGRPQALVEKVRPGSIAEVEGLIKEGKLNAVYFCANILIIANTQHTHTFV